MSEVESSTVYQLKVVVLGASPMIWHCLLVRSNCTITDLHYILQIAIGRDIIKKTGNVATVQRHLGHENAVYSCSARGSVIRKWKKCWHIGEEV